MKLYRSFLIAIVLSFTTHIITACPAESSADTSSQKQVSTIALEQLKTFISFVPQVLQQNKSSFDLTRVIQAVLIFILGFGLCFAGI